MQLCLYIYVFGERAIKGGIQRERERGRDKARDCTSVQGSMLAPLRSSHGAADNIPQKCGYKCCAAKISLRTGTETQKLFQVPNRRKCAQGSVLKSAT